MWIDLIHQLTINLSIDKLTKTIKENPDAKIITPVHYAGLACKMNEIKNSK